MLHDVRSSLPAAAATCTCRALSFARCASVWVAADHYVPTGDTYNGAPLWRGAARGKFIFYCARGSGYWVLGIADQKTWSKCLG